MIFTKENKERYRRLGINESQLKIFYIQEAKRLLAHLKPYNDDYAKELKAALKFFIDNPKKDLIDVIDGIKKPAKWYNSFEINDTLFDIYYPEPEWMTEIKA